MKEAIEFSKEVRKRRSAEADEPLAKRLNVLIALMLDRVGEDQGASMAVKIMRLDGLGLAPSDISAILGKPLNFVTATLSQQRKASKKGKK